MANLIMTVKEEIDRLETMLKHIDSFLQNAPSGCLKWQRKNKKIYYYKQYMKTDSNTWSRQYIKKEDESLAKKLAQKHYYALIKPIAENQLNELKKFVKRYSDGAIDEVYESLGVERKSLITPVYLSVNEQIKQWKEEEYEQTSMYPESLRYETEQGEIVRSKSEVIIANIPCQNQENILYKYERPLEILVDGKVKTIYPDFTVINRHTGKIKYWEHAGRMDDPYYANEFVSKINRYISNGLLPGRDVIVTFETQENTLDIGVVKKIVKEML